MTLKQYNECTGEVDQLEPCYHCKKRPAEIIWNYMPSDFNIKLCKRCDDGGFLDLKLCRQCATHHALAILRDVAEIEVGNELAHARYLGALRRIGL